MNFNLNNYVEFEINESRLKRIKEYYDNFYWSLKYDTDIKNIPAAVYPKPIEHYNKQILKYNIYRLQFHDFIKIFILNHDGNFYKDSVIKIISDDNLEYSFELNKKMIFVQSNTNYNIKKNVFDLAWDCKYNFETDDFSDMFESLYFEFES